MLKLNLTLTLNISQSRLKGISREQSFDDDKDTLSVSSRSGPGDRGPKARSTTYISGSGAGSQTSSKHQDAKKSVPPSPAIKKKVLFVRNIFEYKYVFSRHHLHQQDGHCLLPNPEMTWCLVRIVAETLPRTGLRSMRRSARRLP